VSSTTTAPSTARTASRASTPQAPGRVGGWLQRLDSPVTSYYVLLSVTVVLVVIGLIMVLSASSVKSLVQTDNATPYVFFRKQLQFAAMGAVAMVVAARVPLRAWKALSVPILVGALFLQLLVFTPLGLSVNGNRNWLSVGPISLQPSEFAKVGLVLVGVTSSCPSCSPSRR
jgi:cell division protein FtsW